MKARLSISIAVLSLLALAIASTDAGAAPGDEAIRLDEPTGPLTLDDALRLALARSPALAAASWSVRASEAQIRQARLIPNPTLEAESEEIDGLGGGAFDAAATTIAVAQPLELGGKRSRRTRAAQVAERLASRDYDAARLAVRAETTKAFVEVLAAQERLRLNEELLALSQRLVDVVALRVEAGKVSPVESTRASITLIASRIERDKVRRSLEAGAGPPGRHVGKPRAEVRESGGKPRDGLPAHPRPGGAGEPGTEGAGRGAVGRRARPETRRPRRREGGPDPGSRRRGRRPALRGDRGRRHPPRHRARASALQSEPGRDLAAHHEIARAVEEQRRATTEGLSAVAATYEELSAARTAAIALSSEVLPAATKAFESVGEAYRAGKVPLLDLLDAQRTLYETRGEELEALVSYRLLLAELDRLVGRGLEDGGVAPTDDRTEEVENDHAR
ncbi:MAG: TolC family protein [Acidobacteriota bacterium]